MNPLDKFPPKPHEVPENDLVRHGHRRNLSPFLYHSGRKVGNEVEKLNNQRPEKENLIETETRK
jgi:hypothetical protein